MITIPVWFLPSFYGDVRLLSTGPKTCKVLVEKATMKEQAALTQVSAVAVKKGWVPKGTEAESLFKREQTTLSAPIEKVSKLIAKALKPGRKLLSVVKFVDGKVEELTEASFADEKKTLEDPYRKPTEMVKVEEAPKPEPKAATTVAAPVIGCPAPDFPSAELKAREVLTAFLTPEQIEDFTKYNRFVSVGAETGHRYMITSRHARTRQYASTRALYDIDEGRALCVHDWTVPAAEEMLALHLCLSLPGRENYVRHIPEDGLDHRGEFEGIHAWGVEKAAEYIRRLHEG